MRGFLGLAWRFVVVLSLALWLGGFTVYTAVVIRVGHRHFPGGRFGFVTAEVAAALDLLAAVAALAVSINLALLWKRLDGRLKWSTVATGVSLLLALAAVFVLHAKLDGVLDVQAREIRDAARFGTLHEAYEMAATLFWGAGLLHLFCLLAAWRRLDRAQGPDLSSPG